MDASLYPQVLVELCCHGILNVKNHTTSNGGCRHEEKSCEHWSLFAKLLSSITAIFLFVTSNQEQLYVLIAVKIREK